MKHIFRSWVARAVISACLVAEGVGASYGAALLNAVAVSDLQRKPGS